MEITGDPKASVVFISYSWDSDEHSEKVLELADTLELKGLEVIFDQYDPNPVLPWPKWMANGIAKADFVLCVCTSTYHERVNEDQPTGTGLGCLWEGSLIYNVSTADPSKRKKFIPILLPGFTVSDIPEGLQGNTRFALKAFDYSDRQFEVLIRILTNQPAVIRPARGQVEVLPPKTRLTIPRSSSPVTPTGGGSNEERHPTVTANAPAKIKKPSRGDFLRRRAWSLMERGHWNFQRELNNETIKCWKQARELDGSVWVSATTRIVIALINEDLKEESLVEAEELRARAPLDNDVQATYFAAQNLNGALDNQQEAARSLLSAEELSPDSIQIAAILLDVASRSDEAIALLETSPLTLDSKVLSGTLAQLYAERSNFEKAVVWARTSAMNGPEDPRVWVRFGKALLQDRRVGLALAAFKRSLTLYERFPRALYGLATCYAVMSEAEKSAEFLSQAALLDPTWLDDAKDNADFDSVRMSEPFRLVL